MASIKYLTNRRTWQVRWHVTVKHGPFTGNVKSGSKTFKKKIAAEMFLKETEKKEDYWAAGIDIAPHSIKKAYASWEAQHTASSPRAKLLYTQSVTDFIEGLPQSIVSITKIRPAHILQHMTNYKTRLGKPGNKTVNNQLDAIRNFCKYLTEHFEITNPAIGVSHLKEAPAKGRFLTDSEYQKALDNADDHLDMILFLANTGLRVQEYCDAKWRHLDPKWEGLTVVGKGQKTRPAAINQTCRDILKKLNNSCKPNDYIFLSKSKGQLTRSAVYKRCTTVAKRAGVDKFGPHALRHYFATTLMLKEVPIYLVSKLLGHSSIAITEQAYIHILPKHLTGATDVLG